MELTLFGFPLPFLSESHMNSDMKAHRSPSGRPFLLLFWSACPQRLWDVQIQTTSGDTGLELPPLRQVSTVTGGLG